MAALIASPKPSSFKSVSWRHSCSLTMVAKPLDLPADSNLLLSGSLSDKDFLSVPSVYQLFEN